MEDREGRPYDLFTVDSVESTPPPVSTKS